MPNTETPTSRSSSGKRREFRTPVIGVGTLNIGPRAKELVLEALNNNRLSYGPMSQRFEEEFARVHQCRFGVLSNSGTSALQVAFQAMKELHGWNDGDEVIVPAVTFVATVNTVLHNRLRPVLVDIDPAHYELDPEKLEAKITPRTRAVVPVHLFGQPADMRPIREIAHRRGLKIVEDSAECMFASYEGQRVGSLGDIACFSTYAAHLLVTGVGGLNVTNNPEYAVRLRSLVNHGRDSIYISIDDDKDKSKDELRMIVARRFKFVSPGHSFRITEMEAALGLAQLESWRPMIEQRRANAAYLTHALRAFQDRLQLPSIRPGSEHSFMMYPVVLRDEPKQDMVNFLEEHGVETRDMLPLTNQPVYADLLQLREHDFPRADWVNKSGFYVGCHQDLAQVDLEYIVELFERYWRQRRRQTEQGATLVLLTRNSAPFLERAMEEVPLELFSQLVAFDDGSTDATREILGRFGVSVVDAAGRGPSEVALAEETGLRNENVVFFPADGRHDARNIARLLLVLERGNDMVVASRFIAGGDRKVSDGPGRLRSLGNRFFNLAANILFFGNLSDSLSQFRAVRRLRLEALRLTDRGLPFHYRLSIRAMKQGWRLAELPTVESVSPGPETRRQIVRSIGPVFAALAAEWFSKGRGGRP